ncbi:MAG: alpha/beta fold hydrolase [Sulfuritalea sp.]|nr:alpha/beta fold hydrolase [Sulfuritalea sp.]
MLTPPRHAFPDAELELMEAASLMPVPMAGGRLVGWRWGRARDPVVVLMHGWGGRGTQLQALVVPLLERGYSVAAFDAPGHGMTGGEESSLPHFVQALNAVLDHLGSVHAIIGHSVGAAVTAMIMAQRPAIGRAILIAPPASLIASSRRIAAALQWPEALRAAMQRGIEQRFGISWNDFEAERTGGVQPLLVIHDRHDREVPLAEGMRHLRRWPHVRLMETSGLGHRRLLDDPAVIAAAVDFIVGVRP